MTLYGSSVSTLEGKKINDGQSKSMGSLTLYVLLHIFANPCYSLHCMMMIKCTQYTVKSRFNEWPPSSHFDFLNQDFTLN